MDRESSSSYIFSANNSISEMRRAMRLVIQKEEIPHEITQLRKKLEIKKL